MQASEYPMLKLLMLTTVLFFAAVSYIFADQGPVQVRVTLAPTSDPATVAAIALTIAPVAQQAPQASFVYTETNGLAGTGFTSLAGLPPTQAAYTARLLSIHSLRSNPLVYTAIDTVIAADDVAKLSALPGVTSLETNAFFVSAARLRLWWQSL
jgi:hypothetical protein